MSIEALESYWHSCPDIPLALLPPLSQRVNCGHCLISKYLPTTKNKTTVNGLYSVHRCVCVCRAHKSLLHNAINKDINYLQTFYFDLINCPKYQKKRNNNNFIIVGGVEEISNLVSIRPFNGLVLRQESPLTIARAQVNRN